MSPKKPRRLCAIMFTDMVGYTALMQENEALAAQKRDRHRQVFRSTHEQFGGEIVQYFGDGTLSVFDSVVQALNCSIAIQEQLQKKPRIDLRIGINLGEVVFDEEDIYGDGVNLASRIESFSIPGAVLTSDAVYQQVKNQSQFSFVSLGTFHFKNVKAPQEVFALSNAGLKVPQPHQLEGKGSRSSADKHHFPNPLTSFIGRVQEIREINSLIEQYRLVTITGTGGTGKSRVALQAANAVVMPFDDGIWWIELAPVSDPNQVGTAIVEALGIHQEVNQGMEDILIKYLRNRKLLLLLDNFEQILAAAPLINRILKQCKGVRIVVTSRVPLGIWGEQEYPLEPLPLPDLATASSQNKLAGSPSVELFVSRAQLVKPGFRLDTDNAVSVAQICIELDGLPLAIELAAARIKIFPPNRLLEKLSNRLDLLRTNNINIPARHQTLYQTINWSYELLEPKERKLLQRLAVFVGGNTLEAAEEVCAQNGLADWDLVEGMEALVSKSLVRVNENADAPRYYMLETIRDFARSVLEQSENQYAFFCAAHARYYLQLAEAAHPHLTGSDQRFWYAKLDDEYANLKAAIHWCEKTGKADWVYRFGYALWRFWAATNRVVEGQQTINGILNLPLPEADLSLRLKLLHGMGSLCLNTNDILRAVSIFEEIIEGWTKLNNEEQVANHQNNISWALMFIGKKERGEALTQQALTYHQRSDNVSGQCLSLNNLGGLYFYGFGQPRKALNYFNQSLALREQLGDERGIGFVKIFIGSCYSECGAYEKAQKTYEEAFAIHRARKDHYMMIMCLIHQVEMEFQKGNLEAIPPIVDQIDHLDPTTGIASSMQAHLLLQKTYGLLLSDPVEAEKWIEKALNLMESYSIVIIHRFIYIAGGYLWLEHQAYDRAHKYFRQALKVGLQQGHQFCTLDALELLSVVLAKLGKPEASCHFIGKAEKLRQSLQILSPLRNRPHLNSIINQLKDKLGEKEFAKLVYKGSTMNYSELSDR